MQNKKELRTIGKVSKVLGISSRMLRYYEQIGLIESVRENDSGYRFYDQYNIKKLQQIIIMRKLLIPVKQIKEILNNQDAVTAINIFKQNIRELDGEIAALDTIRTILMQFITELEEKTKIQLKLDMLNDESILSIVDSLSLPNNHIKEDKTIEDLNKANQRLIRIQDIRVIFVPPMTIASFHYVGEQSEMNSLLTISKFVRESGLLEIKPDSRHFGLNNPVFEGEHGSAATGYERWVSIPDDMEVPAPLKKIQFHGGLYAAHAIKFWDFDHWDFFHEWLKNNQYYVSDWGSFRCTPADENMERLLEEQLNFYNNVKNLDFYDELAQLDLLFPIKEKEML